MTVPVPAKINHFIEFRGNRSFTIRGMDRTTDVAITLGACAIKRLNTTVTIQGSLNGPAASGDQCGPGTSAA